MEDQRTYFSQADLDESGDGFYLLFDQSDSILMIWYDAADDEWRISHVALVDTGLADSYRRYE